MLRNMKRQNETLKYNQFVIKIYLNDNVALDFQIQTSLDFYPIPKKNFLVIFVMNVKGMLQLKGN